MLVLQGKLRGVTQVGGGINRKTGEVIPVRDVIQVETLNDRGMVEIHDITVPDPKRWAEKVEQVISVPVRAWAPGATVRYAFSAGAK